MSFPSDCPPVVVLTADQRASRRGPDRVPDAIDVLIHADDIRPTLPPERTAGDEIQTVLGDATSTVLAVEALTRLGGWRIGLGIGGIEHPLPSSTRAARGTAFIAARDAIEAARGHAAHLAVVASLDSNDCTLTTVGGDDYGHLQPDVAVEHALTLLVTTLTRRTEAGWEIVDLIEDGLTGRAAARQLGISESAVSQRLSRAAHEEGGRARELSVDLLTMAGVPR